MAVAAFLTAALESALDNEVATPEDILRHATPDVLAAHLPRAVWTRLLTVCLAAPTVDAQLVVETIGVGTLCEHVPGTIMWGCLSEIAMRTLGRGLVKAPPSVTASAGAPAAAPAAAGAGTGKPPVPPPPASGSSIAARVATPPRGTALGETGRAPTNGGAAQPAAAAAGHDAAAEVTRVAHPPADLSRLSAEKSEMRGELTRVATAPGPREPEPLGEPPAPPRAPGATTRGGSPAMGARRPQATATATPAAPPGGSTLAKAPRGTPPSPRRATTATDFEIETDVGEAWKRPAATPPPVEVVEEEQLVDWLSSEETATSGDKYGDRKPR